MTIRYSTGEEAQVGDHVDYHGELSIVDDVIDTDDALRRWGLDEHGIMLANDSFGLVFEPLDGPLLDEEILFLDRRRCEAKT